MKKPLPLLLGGLLLVLGSAWTLHGLGYLSDSTTDVALWAVVGPLVAGFGLALMIVTVRERP